MDKYEDLNINELMNVDEIDTQGSLIDKLGIQCASPTGNYDYDEVTVPDFPDMNSQPENRGVDIVSDYIAVRDNYYFQQKLLKGAAERAYQVAITMGDPKSMQAFTFLMNQMTNNNKQILEIQKRMHDLMGVNTKNKQSEPQSIVAGDNSTIFVGSPADLIAQRGGQQESAAKAKEKVIEGELSDVDPTE